jgi:hypothetical protein
MYNTIYSCGSSFSCAGGLNWDNVIAEYRNMHDINITNHIEHSYPNIVSKELNLKIVNQSIPGGSTNRMIRRVYDYIYNHSEIDNTLFLIEIPPMWRDEIYSNEIDRIINLTWGVLKYGVDDKTDFANGYTSNDIGYLHNDLISYFNKFINVEFEIIKTMNNLVGLFSFLTLKKINFIIINGYEFYNYIVKNNIENSYNFYWYDGIITPLSQLFIDRDMTISSELNYKIDDNHLGYFANYIFANNLIEYLKNKNNML